MMKIHILLLTYLIEVSYDDTNENIGQVCPNQISTFIDIGLGHGES